MKMADKKRTFSKGQRGTEYPRRHDLGKSSVVGRAHHLNSDSEAASAVDNQRKFDEIQKRDDLDEKLGFYRFDEGSNKIGWMVNMHPTLLKCTGWPTGRSACDYYFIEEDGNTFKCTLTCSPRFLIVCKDGAEGEIEEYLRRKYERTIEKLVRLKKNDLNQSNHLVGLQQSVLQLQFRNEQDLLKVRRDILAIVKRNQAKTVVAEVYHQNMCITVDYSVSERNKAGPGNNNKRFQHNGSRLVDAIDCIVDIREYDIPYYLRVAMDNDLRVGLWYKISIDGDKTNVAFYKERVLPPDPVVFAFDIETTKLPLRFPDAKIDSVMMISYMVDGQGYLITNREVVSEDINDFEYTPKPEFEGPFVIFNELNEEALLRRFFQHVCDVKPHIFVTYNGDFFDWPFIETRAQVYGLDMHAEIGVYKDQCDEYKSYSAAHMDCYRWVKRDSYLPAGSHGLKAVTTIKLGYNPIELDPEDMTRFALEQPQTLASYSVSDAVATYYLYMKYVHPFIFSLCNIIPLNPDEVLRKGSGTLCETLLMVEAYKANVVMPNKHTDETGQLFEGHLLHSETYVGGHVEALQAGVFRSDIPTKFKLVSETVQKLMDDLDRALRFTLKNEAKINILDVINYDEIRHKIQEKLQALCDTPNRFETPLIYHLDVAAMYPNIILTNRLQPDAVVTENTCATCDLNQPDANCQRPMSWLWRGEYYPAQRSEYNMLKNQLESERFPSKNDEGFRLFRELSRSEQQTLLQKRLSDYSRKVYKKMYDNRVLEKTSIVCQRENSFYIDTVRNFRDRRYEYKDKLKLWKRKQDEAMAKGDISCIAEAKKMVVVMDSLQTAHKCILNSFYGYVMRKGSRWFSMEMGGIVCHTGSKIIQMARKLVEHVGIPLELDTDGIWCALPSSFPETFTFQLSNGKSHMISYPCSMLNHLVHDLFTNHQYQDLLGENRFIPEYETRSENSIFFEVDGPYHAMILPASLEEDKLLKKRYAVFNKDGSVAELKGFEMKRRGELKLIKIFQSQIFPVFLRGNTLEECYAAVAQKANEWLDVLDSRGATCSSEDLLELLSENRSMSRALVDYGTQKSTAITTAKRLAEFLGDQMVKDKGLACRFIVSAQPAGAPVAERAIPVVILQADDAVKKHYLRRWTKNSSMDDFDIRTILDWNYYRERFGSVLQKLITIPAAMQKISNPIPRIAHPDWLSKRVSRLNDTARQSKLPDMFGLMRSRASETVTIAVSEMYVNEVNDVERVVNDLEDLVMASPAGCSSGNRASTKMTKSHKPLMMSVVKRKRILEDERTPAMRLAELQQETPPSPMVDYRGWLAYQKQKWRLQRMEHISKRHLFGQHRAARAKSGVSGGVAGMLSKQTEFLASKKWFVLQLAETEVPGDYRLWCLVEHSLHPIQLQIPRIFYVNAHTPPPRHFDPNLISMERVRRTLPRSHRPLHLYKLSMAESVYRQHAKTLASFFSHPSIEGVYETRVPLDFRALLDLGCGCSLSKSTPGILQRGQEEGFLLTDLQHEVLSGDAYLDSCASGMQFLYLFHAQTDSRALYALVPTGLERAYIHIVDPGTNNQIPNATRTYTEWRARHISLDSIDAPLITLPETCHFIIEVHRTDVEAVRAMTKTLHDVHSSRLGPTVVVIQSPKPKLASVLRPIQDFPHVVRPTHPKDYDFPALDWQKFALKRLFVGLFDLGSWMKERIRMAQYADIPFCNIDNDAPIFLADIFFARRLYRQDCVLWYSPSTRPDLGGREDDENRFVLDEIMNPEVNTPGFYENMCVDIDMMNLAVNSILESSSVNDLEDTSLPLLASSVTSNGMLGSEVEARSIGSHLNSATVAAVASIAGSAPVVTVGAGIGVGIDAVSPTIFHMIRSMVRVWVTTLLGTKNKYADMMLEHFYRWVSSTASRLHDPCLHAAVHTMMRKVFMQLIAECKRMGCTVVYANLGRILLVTSKKDLPQAKTYVDYLMRMLGEKPLFHALTLDPTYLYAQLAWIDSANWAGVQIAFPGGENQNTENIHPVDTSSTSTLPATALLPDLPQNLAVEMHWNIRDYLPSAMHRPFDAIIAEFFTEIYQHRFNLLQRSRKGHHGLQPIKPSAAVAQLDPSALDTVLSFKRALVSTYLKRKIFNLIPDMHRSQHGTDGYHMPLLPGSHLDLTNPTLEFIKYTTTVFGLDKDIEREVRVLRRNALDLIHIREFASEAQFRNPCKPFRLTQVICHLCNFTHDLDFCRDPALLPRQNGTHRPWECPNCGAEYNRTAIEENIVDLVQRQLMAYQLQDVRCSKCRLVKRENLAVYCGCSGRFETLTDRHQLIEMFKVILNVARFHGLELLAEVVQWTLLSA